MAEPPAPAPPNGPPGWPNIWVKISRAGIFVTNPVSISTLTTAEIDHLYKHQLGFHIDVKGYHWGNNAHLDANLINWPHSAPGAESGIGSILTDDVGYFYQPFDVLYEEPTGEDPTKLATLKIFMAADPSVRVNLTIPYYWFFPGL